MTLQKYKLFIGIIEIHIFLFIYIVKYLLSKILNFQLRLNYNNLLYLTLIKYLDITLLVFKFNLCPYEIFLINNEPLFLQQKKIYIFTHILFNEQLWVNV